MSDNWSTEDLAAKVEREGLDYAIMHYFGDDIEIEDAYLKEQWLIARKALLKIDQILAEYYE